MKTAFIINPISGIRAKGSSRLARISAFVEKKGINGKLWETRYQGHATELATEAVANGCDRVVCVGGDGTINEVAKALIETGVLFGIVPMGSGNGLARHLGIPLGFDKALEYSLSSNARLIDTGEANGHAFVNVMGLGFDAELGKRFNECKQRGFMSYLKIGLTALSKYRSINYEIDSDNRSHSSIAYVVAIANSSQYGSNAYIAPDASVTDGKLNLVQICTPSAWRSFWVGLRLFNKSIYQSPFVENIASSQFTLKLPRPGFFHADGEIVECGKEVNVVARPMSLNVVAPASNG